MTSSAPLDGIVVLDLTRVLSGPFCTMLLGDMGARVIKVEQPGKGDDTRAWGPPFTAGESTYFLGVNRNKESVTLDFKAAGGRTLLEQLIARADVLVENFRPGTLDRIGLGYAEIHARFPRLIYCSISGFGHTGPRRAEAGYDAVIQAEGGLMSITGASDGPPYRLGTAVADLAAGMFAAQGVLLALLARHRSGAGQHVDIAMLDSVMALLPNQVSASVNAGVTQGRIGNAHPNIAPYDTFAAADGEIMLAVGNDDQFRRFCDAAGAVTLAADPRYATNPSRVTHRGSLQPQIAAIMKTRTREAWLAALRQAGVPCGSVRAIDEVTSDPQVAARQMLEAIEHATAGAVRVLGLPVKLSDTPGSIRRPPPLLGQHTDAVLAELGLGADDIGTLRASGVV